MSPDDKEVAQPRAEAQLRERVEQLETEVARLRTLVGDSGEDGDPQRPERPLRGWRRGGVVTAKFLFVLILLNGLFAEGIDAVRAYRKGQLDDGILMTIGFLVSLAICSMVAGLVVMPWLRSWWNRIR